MSQQYLQRCINLACAGNGCCAPDLAFVFVQNLNIGLSSRYLNLSLSPSSPSLSIVLYGQVSDGTQLRFLLPADTSSVPSIPALSVFNSASLVPAPDINILGTIPSSGEVSGAISLEIEATEFAPFEEPVAFGLQAIAPCGCTQLLGFVEPVEPFDPGDCPFATEISFLGPPIAGSIFPVSGTVTGFNMDDLYTLSAVDAMSNPIPISPSGPPSATSVPVELDLSGAVAGEATLTLTPNDGECGPSEVNFNIIPA